MIGLQTIERGETELKNRAKILAFEKFIASVPGAVFGDNEICPLKHTFSGNIYVREIFIPKGTLLTGKIHRHQHPNFLMSGEVSVVTETGGVEKLKAPMAMISEPGTKRVVYAHEDTVWITIHEVGGERDLKKIEEIVIAKTYEEIGFDTKNLPEIKSDEENLMKMLEFIKSEGA